jgi:ParB family transcriptional regulator, chromosome partitioning protein
MYSFRWRKIVCHIAELDDKEAFEVSLIENIQRKNLEPIEQAHAFKNYVLTFGWGGISELSTKIGKSVSYIDKMIRLLDLPTDILDSISKSEINRSTTEELLSIETVIYNLNLRKLYVKKDFHLDKHVNW